MQRINQLLTIVILLIFASAGWFLIVRTILTRQGYPATSKVPDFRMVGALQDFEPVPTPPPLLDIDPERTDRGDNGDTISLKLTSNIPEGHQFAGGEIFTVRVLASPKYRGQPNNMLHLEGIRFPIRYDNTYLKLKTLPSGNGFKLDDTDLSEDCNFYKTAEPTIFTISNIDSFNSFYFYRKFPRDNPRYSDPTKGIQLQPNTCIGEIKFQVIRREQIDPTLLTSPFIDAKVMIPNIAREIGLDGRGPEGTNPDGTLIGNIDLNEHYEWKISNNQVVGTFALGYHLIPPQGPNPTSNVPTSTAAPTNPPGNGTPTATVPPGSTNTPTPTQGIGGAATSTPIPPSGCGSYPPIGLTSSYTEPTSGAPYGSVHLAWGWYPTVPVENFKIFIGPNEQLVDPGVPGTQNYYDYYFLAQPQLNVYLFWVRAYNGTTCLGKDNTVLTITATPTATFSPTSAPPATTTPTRTPTATATSTPSPIPTGACGNPDWRYTCQIGGGSVVEAQCVNSQYVWVSTQNCPTLMYCPSLEVNYSGIQDPNYPSTYCSIHSLAMTDTRLVQAAGSPTPTPYYIDIPPQNAQWPLLWVDRAGEHTYTIPIDYDLQQVDDTFPDLTVVSMELYSDPSVATCTIELQTKIKNIGQTTSLPFTVMGNRQTYRVLTGLAPGQEMTLRFSDYRHGTFMDPNIVRVDSDDEVAELREDNNILQRYLFLGSITRPECQNITPPPNTTPGGTGTGTPGSGTGVPLDMTKVNIKLTVKLQGVRSETFSQQYSHMKFGVAVGAEGKDTTDFVKSDFVNKGDGVYEGIVTFDPTKVPRGNTYKLLVKGPKHLAKRFCSADASGDDYFCAENAGAISLAPGLKTFDFSTVPMAPGDLPLDGQQDGVVDSSDLTYIRQNLGKKDPGLLKIGDLNLDGIIDTQDFSLVINNLINNEDER